MPGEYLHGIGLLVAWLPLAGAALFAGTIFLIAQLRQRAYVTAILFFVAAWLPLPIGVLTVNIMVEKLGVVLV